MNPTRAHEAAMVDLAQRRIVALEDVVRFEARLDRIEIDFRARTVRLWPAGNKSPWVHQWAAPDPTKAASVTTRDDRPHDLAALVKAAMRLVGFAAICCVLWPLLCR